MTVEDELEVAFQAIVGNVLVKNALEEIKERDSATLEEQKRVTEIPAPLKQEARRAKYYLGRMRDLGLPNASIDDEGNVIGLRRGGRGKPKLVLSAHLDTVSKQDLVKVKEKDGVIIAPGIGDDGRGLAVLLEVLRTITAHAFQTVGDILFVGTVGEEGEGDLRGVKALFREHRDIDGFISIDELGVERVVNRASGSRRHKITFNGPGGHSYDDFGHPSALHAMGRAIAKIADMHPPSEPKTTFTVGTVEGPGSVNAISGQATMRVDMRSSQIEQILKLEQDVLGFVNDAVREENERWASGKTVTIKIEPIGDRPPGMTPIESPIVQAACHAVAAVSEKSKVEFIISSTDANVAMYHGVPAVTIGGGGEGGGGHTDEEWFKPTESYLGPQSALLMVLVLVGLEGVTEPALMTRS